MSWVIRIIIYHYHVLSWPKLGLELKFHDFGTFDGFGKRKQDSCFISIDCGTVCDISNFDNQIDHDFYSTGGSP